MSNEGSDFAFHSISLQLKAYQECLTQIVSLMSKKVNDSLSRLSFSRKGQRIDQNGGVQSSKFIAFPVISRYMN